MNEKNGGSRRSVLGMMAAGPALMFGTRDSRAQASDAGAGKSARSFAEFGALPDGLQSSDETYAAMSRAWQSALAGGHDLHHPGGIYDIGPRNYPWRQGGRVTALLDCRNVTIFGNGPGSMFRTTSAEGADVFQLRGLRNLHFRNLAVTAVLNGHTGSGSNGISVTDGYDNITLLDIWCLSLPGRDTGREIDGGKALTIQCDAALHEVGTLVARVIARDCAQGVGIEAGLDNFTAKKLAIDVELTAERCYTAVAIGGAPARSAVPEDSHWGIRVAAQAINCQKDVWLARAYGVDVDCQIITTTTAAQRRLTTSGSPWFRADPLVEALVCGFAKNSRVRVTGNKGECDYKARVGGAPADLGGLGATTDCELTFDIAGHPARAALAEIDSGGNSLTRSRLTVTSATGAVPPGFFLAARDNLITHGSSMRLTQPTVAGTLTFVGADGRTPLAELFVQNDSICLRQRSASAAEAPILSFLDHEGRAVAKIRNDGLLAGTVLARQDVSGGVVAVRPEYDQQNRLIGYVPVYRGTVPAR